MLMSATGQKAVWEFTLSTLMFVFQQPDSCLLKKKKKPPLIAFKAFHDLTPNHLFQFSPVPSPWAFWSPIILKFSILQRTPQCLASVFFFLIPFLLSISTFSLFQATNILFNPSISILHPDVKYHSQGYELPSMTCALIIRFPLFFTVIVFFQFCLPVYGGDVSLAFPAGSPFSPQAPSTSVSASSLSPPSIQVFWAGHSVFSSSLVSVTGSGGDIRPGLVQSERVSELLQKLPEAQVGVFTWNWKWRGETC